MVGNYLRHHGIKGQRWRVRRYQNYDGSLTPLGRARLGYSTEGAVWKSGMPSTIVSNTLTGTNLPTGYREDEPKENKDTKEKKKETTEEETTKTRQKQKDILDQMKENSQKWANATTDEERKQLAKENEELAKKLSKLTGESIEKDGNGVWHLGNKNLYDEDPDSLPVKKKAKSITSDEVQEIISEMKEKSKKWSESTTDEEKQHLANMNKEAAKKVSEMTGKEITIDGNGVWHIGKKTLYDAKERSETSKKVKKIVSEMKENSEKWKDASDEEKESLSDSNKERAKEISELTGEEVYIDENGEWHKGKKKLYGSKKKNKDAVSHGDMLINSEEIRHHGIKGQRWGVRRFENADGTLTEEGKRRYYKSPEWNLHTHGKDDAVDDVSVINRVKRSEATGAQSSLNATRNITNDLSNIIRTIPKKEKKYDYSDISDEELRKRVNRLNMEKQYNQLTASNVRTGRDKALETLTIAGSIAAIGASAAQIYVAIHQAKYGS